MRYCCSRCAMSISVDSVSPRRDFFMKRAYEGTAMDTRMDTMATAIISSTSVKPAAWRRVPKGLSDLCMSCSGEITGAISPYGPHGVCGPIDAMQQRADVRQGHTDGRHEPTSCVRSSSWIL